MSVPHEQKPEITEAAAGSDLRLRSREQAESSSKYTPTRAYNEDSELHNGIAELGNELIDQPRQQESNNAVAKGSSSNAFPARATIIAGGAEVYIAYTGLDCIYIEALPEHMREEVLNQYFRKQRPAKEKVSVPVSCSISTDFLEPLPP
ncbi:hypothetical protein BY996DRAFT_8545015 [Phakopsora pachyrhizi]|nr:hypothetical protein BY996DRAFT_8545015 [Phakopsora pachyrhizi]